MKRTGEVGGAIRARRVKVSVGTALLVLAAAYVLAPLYWLLIASTKSSSQLFSTSTFLPPVPFLFPTKPARSSQEPMRFRKTANPPARSL